MATLQCSSPRFAHKSLAIMVFVIGIFSPLAVFAEAITFVRNADQIQASPEQSIRKKARLALDDDGNVMVRFRRVSVTFIYDTGGTAQESRLQSGTTAARQEVACLGGVSVKLGVTF